MRRIMNKLRGHGREPTAANQDALANQDDQDHTRPNIPQISATVNPPANQVLRAPAATRERVTALRRNAEIEADLATWRTQGEQGEDRTQAVRRIRNCVQNNDASLCLSYLGLTSLPISIGKITQLKELALDHNALSSLPENICELGQLQRLKVDHNQLTSLPETLGDMTELRTLHANDNRLPELPQSTGALRNLLDLRLQNNRMRQFPAHLNTLRSGTIVQMKNNLFSDSRLAKLHAAMEDDDYHGPVFYLDQAPGAELRAGGADPFATISDAQKIEALLEAAATMSDGRDAQPQNFRVGFRDMNKKECLLMALEFALDSHRNLIPVISQRLVSEMPSDTEKFLIKGVNFTHDRINEWSRDQSLPVQADTAREVVDIDASMYEPDNDQNVHDPRVRNNFIQQFGMISARVAAPVSVELAAAGITHLLNPTGEQPDKNDRALCSAIAGLKRVMEKTDVVRGFTLSPPATLATVWTHIENTDDALKILLRDSLKNRLAEIGDGRICALGLTERLIDIPTAVDWSVTKSISLDQINTELARMASDVNEEYESMFGADADKHRAAAEEAGDTERLGDIEMRINGIKRDMFFAKAKVELVLLRDLDEELVRGQLRTIFPSGDGMRNQM